MLLPPCPPLPGQLCAALAAAVLSLLSTQHGLLCSGSSSFPPCWRELPPTLVTGVCVSHPSDCCPSLGTTHHNCCTFLVPLGLQEALRLEPSLNLHYMRHLHTVSAGCPGFAPLCSLRCCSVVQRSFLSPHVVLCHRNILSSADASASGGMVREEGRSAVGSGCMAGQPLAGFPLPAQTASAGSTCLAAHLLKGLSLPGVLALEAAAGCRLIGDR